MEVGRNVIFCLVESVCKMWCGVNFVCYALVFSKIRGLRSGLSLPGRCEKICGHVLLDAHSRMHDVVQENQLAKKPQPQT